MSLYTIADLHLSLGEGINKSMNVFGPRWQDYVSKIESNWRRLVRPEDTVVIPGDVSWGMDMAQSLPDFKFIDALPGRKLLCKGNHDYWWTTVSKMRRALSDGGVTTMEFLHNCAYIRGDIVICGSRGWFIDEDDRADEREFNQKILNREAQRLEASLREGMKLREQRGGGTRITAFLHYPPIYGDYRCDELLALLQRYGVSDCYYGHIHTPAQSRVVPEHAGCRFHLVAADQLAFVPLYVG